MALTNAEQIKILKLLGWPAKTIVSTSLSYSKIISDRLIVTDADVLVEIRTYLTRADELDAKLKTGINRTGVKSIGDIEFFGTETSDLRGERKRLLKELASFMDIATGPGFGGGSMGSISV